ncbi:MAG: S1/P1 nuclease [Gammaproteobacteria bacterium]|nr:S1/P1 nuclease [Gammaproteobacteria bacterium]MDP7269883.1 S1/P1 nuclease [Gammaproteobacteria bacterium]
MPTMPRAVKQITVILSAIFLVSWNAPSYGFGSEAHRIVGHIADRYTCAGTREALERLTPGENLSVAGLWADRIRGDKSWLHAQPWHYMNVPDDTDIADREISADGDVLLAIERFRAELEDQELSAEKRANALRFLVHFVADIHQPLHVGRRGDLGGNTIDVRVGRDKTNLHAYWDSYALEQVVESSGAYAARLVRKGYPSETDGRAMEPVTWADESKEYRDEVYACPLDPDSGDAVPDAAYRARALEIIDLRLYQAGLRLAQTLNGIFCSAEAGSSPRPARLSH